MNEALYNDFLQQIEQAAALINTLNDQQKIDKEVEIKSAIDRLNDRATDEFSEFIANNPQSYDAAVSKMREALSYNSDLADSILPSNVVYSDVSTGKAEDQTQPATQDAQAAPAPATTPAAPAAAASTVSEPDQEALDSAFRKYMGSSFNPESSMDKGKMEVVKKALENFQKQNNKPFDINDSEDLGKMQGIMNAAYQSEEYKKAAGVSGGSTGESATRLTRPQTPAQRRATAPASPKGGPTYYVRTGFNRYVPAVEADITSGQQLFMQNPNRAARMVYPYVKVDSRPVRRATPAR